MIKKVLENQYNKCFNMLSGIINKYNDGLWYDDKNYQSPVWQIIYHGVFIANIYCSASEDKIVNWSKSKQDYHFLGNKPWPPFEEVILKDTYTKDEMLEFIEFVRDLVPAYLIDMKPEEKCWPDWYEENQLEFQINNMRHIQHHLAEIIERQNNISNLKYTWE